ncbi:hypothetical protein [Hymenobacter sp. DG25A]|uniref:hypothetical protein n=1 Tax=Hymenobacter sp. DG25A TaxID=1385663 RepID=UPI0018D1251F|nr:hypothetical protein [Hymenobacter sp. DG25A]
MKHLHALTLLLLFGAAAFLHACSKDGLEDVHPTTVNAKMIKKTDGTWTRQREWHPDDILKSQIINVGNLTAKEQKSCLEAFEGKCFHGKLNPVGFYEIQNPSDTYGYCINNQNFCTLNECTSRLNILFGFSLPPSGNKCYAF